MGRSPCCSKEGLNRGAWTAHEDKILTEYIRIHGEGRWRNLPKRAGLKRCGKSCRLRWLNYLRPDIKRGNISSDEEELIIRLHMLLGNRWSLIAGRLPGRTDNEIKNYWNTNLGKRVKDKHSPHLPNGTKTTQNPNPQTPTTSTPAPSLPPKLDSLVVRTKATKCSKVLLLNSLPNNSPMQIQNKSKTEEEVEAGHAVANIDSPRSNNQMEPGLNDNEFMSFLGEEKEELSTTDLLIDFDADGISFSDFLNSDFTNMCNFDVDNNNAEQLSPCSDQTPMFSDEVFKDWTQSSFGEETNVSNKIHSFTLFKESSGDE